MEISQSKVHDDITEFLDLLRSAVSAAVSTYRQAYTDEQKLIHSKRSVASVIHDHIVKNVAVLVEPRTDARLVEHLKLYRLVIDAGYSVRFKKVGADKLTAGHRTKQVRSYRSQQQIDALPPTVNLDLGYEIDEELNLTSVYLICPSGPYSNMWDSELAPSGLVATVVSLFGTQPTLDPEGASLRPKKDKKDDSQSADGDTRT